MTTQAQAPEINAPGKKLEQQVQKLVKAVFSIEIKSLLYPFLGIIVFLMFWSFTAGKIDTSLGKFPGPAQVFTQAKVLMGEHQAERDRADAFYQRQEDRNAKTLSLRK